MRFLPALPILTLCATGGSAVFPPNALAQGYPNRPIRLVVPYPPGGGADTVARIVAAPLSESLGYQMIVDNRGGASGRIGTEIVAKSTPDGYTLLLGNVGPNAIIPSAYANLPYDAVKDFAPISLVASAAYILVVHPSLPVRSMKDLIALAKARPDQLTFASSGNLGGPHLSGELFKYLAKVHIVHVPYKGNGPVLIDLLAGQVSMAFASLPSAAPQVKAQRLRPLGVTGDKRAAAFSEVPAIGEILPGYVVNQWYGVLAPAGAPTDIVDRLHAEIVKALARPDVKRHLSNNGAEAISNTPQEFSGLIRNEIGKWGKVVKEAGIRAE